MLIASATFAQVKFGVTAGPGFSSVTTKANGDKETSKLMTGLRGGITVDLPLADEFYIQPSLLYAGKGGNEEVLGVDLKTRIHYLELPINFMYKPEVGAGNLFIGLGPYIALGLSGKTDGGSAGSVDIDWGDETGQLKKMDAGANFQVGYEFPMGLNVGLFTDLGLVNLAGGDNDNSFKNTSFGLSVGYKFSPR